MRLKSRVRGLSLCALVLYAGPLAAQTTTTTPVAPLPPAAEPAPVPPPTDTATATSNATATGTVSGSVTGSADTAYTRSAEPPTPLATTQDVAPPTVAPAPTAFAPLKIDSANASIKFGLLAQPQFEAAGSGAGLDGGTNNFFVRRTRLLVGGTLFGKFEYFFDTDFPNLFRGTDSSAMNGGGAKSTPAIGVQDVMVTWKAYEDYFKIDAGYMLVPGAHNALQGAGTLYGLDYFTNSFRHANAFNSAGDVGRDAGVEVRGLVLDGHLEYRLGLFQGYREPATATEAVGRNMFRAAGRIQINVFDPETAFFYAGTYLGTKRVLSFGAAYDTQDDYHHWAVDGILDMPLGDAGAVTAQVNFSKWNGGGFLPSPLPNQTAIMAEAGYRIEAVKLSPFVRFERRNIVADGATDENRYGAGLAFWPYAHNVNLKAYYQRVVQSGDAADYNQFNLQWQLYFY